MQAKPETETGAEADQVEGSVTGPWVGERKRGKEDEEEREREKGEERRGQCSVQCDVAVSFNRVCRTCHSFNSLKIANVTYTHTHALPICVCVCVCV